MPLSSNEIKDRTLRFSREWKGEGSERAESQSFWNGFFDVFGIDRRRVAIFEKQVEITRAGRKLKRGRIDAFWTGVLLIEHKSAGEDLERALIASEPMAAQWIRPFLSADEFINRTNRWCLWLVGCPPNVLKAMPSVAARVAAVRKHRLESERTTTKALAATPTLFGENRQPAGPYILVPCHSSERRLFVPMGLFDRGEIVGNSNLCIPDATRYEFGVLGSTMHNAWVRYTCGRLESRYRYSAAIVYNNFPWPENPTDAQKQKIETAAQAVLDARAAHPNASLADLYDPLTMPPNLVKAHQVLDTAVDAAYGRKSFKNDAERVAFLFELYQKYTSLLPAASTRKVRARRSKILWK